MVWHHDLAHDLQQVTARVGPAVVTIGHGAGVVLEAGRVLTNAHNLFERKVAVAFPDGRVAKATVVGVDPDGDLAVLEVDTGAADPIAWADEDPAPGQPVVALANPAGHGLLTTFGTIAATDRAFRGPRGRLIRGAVEHTAPLPRGSSGGPVVDMEGRLLGINTHRRGEGFYLAVPATAELRKRLDRLGAGEEPAHPRLGIAVAPPRVARRMRASVGLDDRGGLLVREVDPEGPAGRAGIRRGDLLVQAASRDLTSSDDLFAVLDDLDPDATLVLGVVRGAEEREVAVTFGSTREEGSA